MRLKYKCVQRCAILIKWQNVQIDEFILLQQCFHFLLLNYLLYLKCMCKLILEYASYKMIIETEIPKAIINLHNNNNTL